MLTGPYGVWIKSVTVNQTTRVGPIVCVRPGPCAYGLNSHTDRNNNMTCAVGYFVVNNETNEGRSSQLALARVYLRTSLKIVEQELLYRH